MQFWRWDAGVKDFGINWNSLKATGTINNYEGIRAVGYTVDTFKGHSVDVEKANPASEMRYNCVAYVFGASEGKLYGPPGKQVKGPFWLASPRGFSALLKDSCHQVHYSDRAVNDIIAFVRNDKLLPDDKDMIHVCTITAIEPNPKLNPIRRSA